MSYFLFAIEDEYQPGAASDQYRGKFDDLNPAWQIARQFASAEVIAEMQDGLVVIAEMETVIETISDTNRIVKRGWRLGSGVFIEEERESQHWTAYTPQWSAGAPSIVTGSFKSGDWTKDNGDPLS